MQRALCKPASKPLQVFKGGETIDLSALLEESAGAYSFSESARRHTEAMDKIHKLVITRERTAKEVKERLVAGGFTPAEASEAVEAALRCGLIDETRYASAFVRGKVHSLWGREKIEQRLKADGVSENAIVNAEEFFASPEDEYANAMKVVSAREARSKNPRVTLVRRLLSKGYSQSLAIRVVDDFLNGCK